MYPLSAVGGGSAGGVLASRLTEDGLYNALLLEAGQDSTTPLGRMTDVPGFQMPTWRTDIDWQYSTVPQKHACKAMRNHVSIKS